MIAVFLAFVASPVPSLKMLGLGLATAVLVDATLVRLMLVPATMTLLGKANWWLPAWLDRLLPGSSTQGRGGRDEDSLLDGAGPGDAHLVDVEPGLDLA
jgi:RND superfamily putative drug exporter